VTRTRRFPGRPPLVPARGRRCYIGPAVPDSPKLPIRVRSFAPADAAACRRLYSDALIGAKLADNDTGLDMDDVRATYMATPGGHFWVAEDAATREVVGMVGVAHHESESAEIRRLRVRTDQHRKGVGSALVETAIRFCSDRHYLKVTFDTFMERAAALKLFEKFRFKLSRAREVGGRTLLYFYLDLYTGTGTNKVAKK